MNTQKSVYNRLFVEAKKTELESQKVELGIVQDLNSAYIQNNSVLDTADKVIDSAVKVNNAIKSVTKDAQYYNKYSSIVRQDINTNIKYIESLLIKAEKSAKELGLDIKNVEDYKKAKKGLQDSKDTVKGLDKNRLEFDI